MKNFINALQISSITVLKCMRHNLYVCMYRRMYFHLNKLSGQHKEGLLQSEDSLSYHLTVMKGLRWKPTVQQSTGVQELIHLNASQQHATSHHGLFIEIQLQIRTVLFIRSGVNGSYLKGWYGKTFSPKCLAVLVQLSALDGSVCGKVFKWLPKEEESI